jgi:hypothetical protein
MNQALFVISKEKGESPLGQLSTFNIKEPGGHGPPQVFYRPTAS